MTLSARRWILGSLGLVVLIGFVIWKKSASTPAVGGRLAPQATEAAARAYLELEARERALEAELWGPEVTAALHEDELLRLWDSLKTAPDPWAVLANATIGWVRLPQLNPAKPLSDGTRVWTLQPDPSKNRLGPDARRVWLQHWADSGWKLVQTTWALVEHYPATAGGPARSMLQFTAHLDQPAAAQRARLRLTAALTWSAVSGAVPELAQLEVHTGELLVRGGTEPFRLWFEDRIPVDRSPFPDPLLLWDLEDDGFAEIILVGADRVWRNRTDPTRGRTWVGESWLGLPAERIVAALRVDVNGDQQDDLITAAGPGIRWWPGRAVGGPGAGTPVNGWSAPGRLKHPQVMTAGDIDGDGDLDLWVAQYKLPYQGGQFPTPWDDANDGFPSYLLRNDGAGHFTDVTDASGLAPKRFRRTYSASWVDLDLDGDLDLVNISDFAGLDVFLNQGQGTFVDVTDGLGPARHGFGMSHVINDLTGDGRPDLLMLGMTSTVADRLGFLNLARGEDSTRRMREMTLGNRLFLGAAGVRPLIPAPEPVASRLARTGWTWGAAWADFDHDGDLDLAVANGHETRANVRDYERQFWRHDRFVAGSANDPVADLYFRTAAGRRQADQASYGGWQSNVLLLNEGDREWPDVAWLWGLALPADSRNVLVEDLDGDGRLDLVVTTQEEWPERRQRLLVYRNELPAGNWVGFRGRGPYPTGARFELETTSGRQSRWCLTGEGYRSQNALSVQFGLGGQRPIRLSVFVPGRPAVFWNVEGTRQWHLLESTGR